MNVRKIFGTVLGVLIQVALAVWAIYLFTLSGPSIVCGLAILIGMGCMIFSKRSSGTVSLFSGWQILGFICFVVGLVASLLLAWSNNDNLGMGI